MTAVEAATKKKRGPGYWAYRKRYEKSEKYLARKRAYQTKRRADPLLKPKYAEYQRRYKNKHKLRALVRMAIVRAKTRGLEYCEEFLKSFVGQRPERCACCSSAFDYSGNGRGNQAPLRAPTLDRVDSAKGYVKGNVAVICWRCNVLKKDGSLAELEGLVKYMKDRL